MEGNISHIPVKQDGHNFFMAHVQVSRKGYSILHKATIYDITLNIRDTA